MKILYCFVFIFLHLTVTSCQLFINGTGSKIIGGVPIPITQAPYQVALGVLTGNSYTQHCGGTLIGNKLVLTAGICLRLASGGMIPTSSLRVFAGETNLNMMSKYSDVSQIIIHREFQTIFDKAIYNDIGIIKLKSAFKLGKNINTIKLSSVPVNPNTVCRITGWGSYIQGGDGSNTLLGATLPIFNKTQCSAQYQKATGYALHPGTICAGSATSTAGNCAGDSGGPLVCNGLLTGIISHRLGCGQPVNYPGVYTDIQFYQDWIRVNGASSISSVVFLTFFLQMILFVVLK